MMIRHLKIRFVMVIFTFIRFTDATLQPHACSAGKFGWQCRYDCNCPGPCHPVTGECDACDGEMWGPGCLLNSLCRHNDQRGEFYQGKRSRIDRDDKPCITWHPQRSGYSADLFPEGDLRKASNYCRDPSKDGFLWCFTKNNPPHRDWGHCNEVQPCDCPKGRFGVNCREECHCKDQANTCSSGSGRCDQDCHERFQGDSCQDCKNGYFGLYCNATCHCFEELYCNKQTGKCRKGCAAGWKGEDCQTECADGTFGRNCEHPCNCLDDKEVCQKANGTCVVSGCAAGWHGPGCLIACNPGSYGPSCKNNCSVNCEIPHGCDRMDGFCVCKAGYQPHTCENKCRPGTYGHNCTSPCNSNCDGPCDHLDGTCTCRFGFMGSRCTEGNVGPLVGLVLGVLIAIALVIGIAVIVVLRNRRNREHDGCKKRERPIDLNNVVVVNGADTGASSGSSGADGQPGESEYYNFAIQFDKSNIPIDQLPDYIKYKTGIQAGFEEEFKTFSKEPAADCIVGKRRGNLPKNRFKNVVPYDKNRVILDTKSDTNSSDYINASYIPGYEKSDQFIAAQGPVDGAVADFLQMLWENNVPLVVMVTALMEDKKSKCERYWPENDEPVQFGDISVSLKSCNKCPHYVERKLVVQKDGESKSVVHLQFISWPDHGAPLSATSFLAFHREAQKYYDNKRGPTVVHCSAGVGRTGTFLAMDYLLKQAKTEGRISVYNCVVEMRKHRICMVQSLDQYIFIHEALMEALNCGKIVHDVSGYEEWFNECSDDVMKTQFLMLDKLKPVIRINDTTDGRGPDNHNKNRPGASTPSDRWRPLLMTPVPGSTNYINAVFVKSQDRKDGLLVTQSPMSTTIVDFWRMVLDYKCEVIVALNVLGTQEFPSYLPDTSDRVGPFTIDCTSVKKQESYTTKKISYRYKKADGGKLALLEVNFETDTGSLPDITTFLAIIEAASSAIQGSAARTLIHCRYGLVESGLFCALMQICDKIKNEQEVDVFHAVKRIRISRPGFVQTPEQYRWLHEAVCTYVKSFSTYANFR